MDTIIWLIILIFSVIVHEVMHGVVADKLGDPTARLAGRLTLNPIPHIDVFGSIILPLITKLMGGFIIGWAKPVPYNPYNLRPGRFSEAFVAGAGPASNFVMAGIAALLIRLNVMPAANEVFFLVVFINVLLAIFNLIPVPPLDGSKVLEALLPRALSRSYSDWRARMEFNPFLGMGIVVLIILLFGSAFSSLVYGVARTLAGT